jgi:hypothetical protein
MMDDEPEPPRTDMPRDTPGAPPRSAAEQKAARLKAALRENLRRRKAQSRGRAGPPDPARDDEPGGDA